jgi:hypothetical protein
VGLSHMANGLNPPDRVQMITTLIGAVTGTVILIYGLGVLGLFWSLYVPQFNTAETSTIWYAASLPPRPVVVVYGLKTLLWPVLANTLVAVVCMLVVVSVAFSLLERRRSLRNYDLPWRWGRREWGATCLAFFLLIIFSFTVLLFPMIDLLKGVPDKSGVLLHLNRVSISNFGYVSLLFVGGLVGGVLLFVGRRADPATQSIMQYILRSTWFRLGCLTIYLVAFPGALLLAGGKPSPLPHAVLLQQKEDSSLSVPELKAAYQHSADAKELKNPRVIEGTLLAHTETYWYLLNGQGDHIMIIPERDKELAIVPTLNMKRTCEDFASRKSAQATLGRDPRDMYNLDKDNDGLACEGVTFNNAPRIVGDEIATPEDTAVVSRVLKDDRDPNVGQTLRIAKVSRPAHGTANIIHKDSNTEEIKYKPATNFHGDDYFAYTACDNGEPSRCAEGKVTAAVKSTNDRPIARDDSYAVAEDTSLRVTAQNGLRSNDKDADEDELSVELVEQPEHATVNLYEDGSFIYKPRADFHGNSSFDYEVRDGKGSTDAGTANIRVESVNDRPVADTGGPYEVCEGGTVAISAFGKDPEGGNLTYDWDLDSDGDFETSGKNADYSAVGLSSPESYEISLRVTDAIGTSSIDEGFVRVEP